MKDNDSEMVYWATKKIATLTQQQKNESLSLFIKKTCPIPRLIEIKELGAIPSRVSVGMGLLYAAEKNEIDRVVFLLNFNLNLPEAFLGGALVHAATHGNTDMINRLAPFCRGVSLVYWNQATRFAVQEEVRTLLNTVRGRN